MMTAWKAGSGLAGIALQLDAVHMQLPDVNTGLRERLDEACNLTRYSLAEARRAIEADRFEEFHRKKLAGWKNRQG